MAARTPITLSDVFAPGPIPGNPIRTIRAELPGIGRAQLVFSGEHLAEAWGPDGFELDRQLITRLLEQQAINVAA